MIWRKKVDTSKILRRVNVRSICDIELIEIGKWGKRLFASIPC